MPPQKEGKRIGPLSKVAAALGSRGQNHSSSQQPERKREGRVQRGEDSFSSEVSRGASMLTPSGWTATERKHLVLGNRPGRRPIP